jgi:hypothetical protein
MAGCRISGRHKAHSGNGCVLVPTDEGSKGSGFFRATYPPGGERSKQAYDIVNENDLQY